MPDWLNLTLPENRRLTVLFQKDQSRIERLTNEELAEMHALCRKVRGEKTSDV